MWSLPVGSLGFILTKNLFLLCLVRHFGQVPRLLLTTGSWFSASMSSATLLGSAVRTYSMNISLSRPSTSSSGSQDVFDDFSS